MHRSRYYRNPAIYQARNECNSNGFQSTSSSHIRKTYRRPSTTPFSPLHSREVKATHYAVPQQNYPSPRFVDRSKYVWTANSANKQQPQSCAQPATVVQSASKQLQSAPVQMKSLQNPRNLPALTVTALDPPIAVAKDIAMNLNENKDYIIRKVVDVVGVKKAIKLYYNTRIKENDGGILIQNGKRRRTPGGVFLTLLRESGFVSQPEAEKVFQEIKKYELQMKVSHHYDSYW